MMESLLPSLWYLTVCGELALYIMLDGANLGIGLLSLFPQKEGRRSLMMHILSPIWNANETWLVVAAGTLFGAFPAAYSIGLNALYVPGVIILVGLIGRAVSFEFHEYAVQKHLWMRVFGISSLLVIIGQGCALGGLLSGIAIENGSFGGSAWNWATPLTAIITIGIICSYIVLGYAYLIGRPEYEHRHIAYGRIFGSALVTFVALGFATFLLPSTSYTFFQRWSSEPTMYFLFADAACIALVSLVLLYDMYKKQHPSHIYYLSLAVFALGALGMLIGTYPYLLPPNLTIADAASPTSTLLFMLWGIGPLLPIILLYNWYLHRVFRKK